jgi:hypothetical protein
MARKLHLSGHKWVTAVTPLSKTIPGRDQGAVSEFGDVRFPAVDITSELQAHSVQAPTTAPCCSTCLRRLLPGETLHVYESGSSLCTLCAAVLSEEPLRRERIHATSVRLAVVPRAA